MGNSGFGDSRGALTTHLIGPLARARSPRPLNASVRQIMALTTEQLKRGLTYWRRTKWPRDFHNADYVNLAAINPSGAFNQKWWDQFLPVLRAWRATRPRGSAFLTPRAQARFQGLLEVWAASLAPHLQKTLQNWNGIRSPHFRDSLQRLRMWHLQFSRPNSVISLLHVFSRWLTTLPWVIRSKPMKTISPSREHNGVIPTLLFKPSLLAYLPKRSAIPSLASSLSNVS